MALLTLLLLAAYSDSSQLDINAGASLKQLYELPVDSAVAVEIYEYLGRYGRLNSIYELLNVPGVTPRLLERLKPLIRVTPRDWDDIRENNIQRVQRRLATEEGPTAAVVEDWGDRLLTPININRATIDDLLVLDNVSLVDAVAVAKYLQGGGRLEGRRDLAGRVDGLSSYGYRGMRDYVTYTDAEGRAFGGNYRVAYDMDPDWFVQAGVADFRSALRVLETDTAELRQGGYTAEEIEFIRTRLVAESAYVSGMRNQSSVRHRLRLRVGDKVRVGGWAVQKLYEPKTLSEWKAFVQAQDLGPLRRLMVGDYRLTIGQGLLMDNNSELVRRSQERAQGLFSDLSENPGFGLRGVAADLNWRRLGVLGFFSSAQRDAILNPDSSVNYYVVATPRYPTMKNVLGETDLGGNVRFDLGNLGFVPLGTRVGVSALSVRTSRALRPEARYLDLPGDAEVLSDPNYLQLDTGRTRLFYGADFRSVIENVSLEGEFAQQRQGGKAYLVKARTQYNYLYVTTLYRHYDVNYSNHYNRGYCEQLRFEDTPLEKSYRLFDPAHAALQSFPMPKAEEGFLIDTRYQIGRQVTFTRAYLDVWRNLAWGADNIRFQGELEYRPVFPVRFRFKEKLQLKSNPRVSGTTESFTMESSIRAMLSLTNWDFLTGEFRYGRVLLTPTMHYNGNSSISGDFVAMQWEHNFSEDLNGEVGVSTWSTRGMSQWMFEDVGIDFLDGQGFKWYVAVQDRVSDNLLVYVKFRHKLSEFPHNGLNGSEGIHYRGGGTVRDFVSRDSRFDIALQIDFLW